jgi:hypothetical protein
MRKKNNRLELVATVDLLAELERRGGHPGALARAALLAVRKSQDYNSEQRSLLPEHIVRDVYFKLGLASYAQMLDVKVTRLISIAQAERAGHALNFESAEDTMLDIVNYAGFGVDHLGRLKK